MSEAEFRRAQLFMARSLAKKEQSTQQIEKKLKERGFSEEIRKRVIEDFQKMGYLDDERWLQNRLSMLKSAKKGPRMISQKLLLEGASREEAKCAKMSAQEEESIIQDLLKTRYARRNLKDRKERDKVIASLCRRGFSLSAILKSIDKLVHSERMGLFNAGYKEFSEEDWKEEEEERLDWEGTLADGLEE